MPKTQILSQKQILSSYKKKIALAFRNQQIAGQATIKAILEIGNLLIEVRDYKDSLVLTYKENVWKEFISELGFSMPSVTRYIKIAEHPILSNTKYHRSLPSSVYSLYEISIIEPKEMIRMINDGMVYSEMGRSEILSLRNSAVVKQVVDKKINLLQVKIPKDLLKGDYQTVLYEIENFLINKKISFEYGPDLKRILKSEKNKFTKIETFVFKKAKRYLDKLGRQMVEEKGIASNQWRRGSKLSFEKKLKKIGYMFEEISPEWDTELEELKVKYLSLGQEDEKFWENLCTEWYQEGTEKFKPHFLSNSSGSYDSYNTEQEVSDIPDVEFNSSRPKKIDFTAVKFKDFKF